MTVPLDLTQLSCPGFTLAAGLPSGFTTTESAAGGEPFGEPAISHDSHHVSLVQWTNLFASRHKGHRFKSPGGYLCKTGILLLAMSRYTFLKFGYIPKKSFNPNISLFLKNMIEFFYLLSKRNVQRKLRWIKNRTYRWVLSPGLDAGHSFFCYINPTF